MIVEFNVSMLTSHIQTLEFSRNDRQRQRLLVSSEPESGSEPKGGLV